MKKVLSIVLVVVMFLLCVPLTASAENTQSFSFELSVDGSDTKEVQTGDVITVLLRLKRTDSAEAYMMYAMQDEILYDSDFWRLTHFVEGTDCFKSATPELFEASARAFGRFQYMLQGYPAETLHETIAKFHDTEDRLRKLKAAINGGPLIRVAKCKAEIDFVLAREKDCSVALQALREGKLPLRVTHNDTKLNNILIDRATGEGICVIDLDTTMPGLSINDFGESIRFGANHSAEDEKDLSKVNFDIELYEVYTRGFLEGAQGSLTRAELEYLPWGARLMTLECGIRFLTDYLEEDHYFRIHYPDQNLDRCRTQFKLVRDMEEQFDQMAAIVRKYAG